MKWRRLLVAAASAIIPVGVVACGGQPGATLTTASPASGSPPAASPSATADAEAPSVSITQPADGTTVPVGDLQVEVDVSGTNLVDKAGSPPVPGEGHLIYYVGVDFVPTQPGRPAYTAPGTYAASVSSTHTWPMLSAGRYGIAVQVVNNDDTPLVPPVTALATIAVQGGTPTTRPNPNASPGQQSSAAERGAPASREPRSNP